MLDQAIAWRSPGVNHAVTLFTDLGGPVVMPIVAAVLTLLMTWRWRSRTPLVLMVIATIGSLAMTTTGKALIGRRRPPLSEAVPPYEMSPSFPSGHTLNATVITASWSTCCCAGSTPRGPAPQRVVAAPCSSWRWG